MEVSNFFAPNMNRPNRHLHLTDAQKGRIISLRLDSNLQVNDIARIAETSVSQL